ncbi:MAG: cupin domain-containing protein [Pseudomonadota bacterium]
MAVKYHTHYQDIGAFVTKDGSIIRELMHPNRHAARSQSLAEARVPTRSRTLLHTHQYTEEIYHVVRGAGRMTLGNIQCELTPGDTVCIAPGTPHCVENTGNEPLVILCMCTPAYTDEDTALVLST